MKTKLEEIGVAWNSESKNGNKYISVTFNKGIRAGKYQKIMLFPAHKETNRSPDYRVIRAK